MPSPIRKLEEKLNAAHVNLLAHVRLAPKNEFEEVVVSGYSTDIFGWFEEAWVTFKARFKPIALSSIPGLLAICISFYLYYDQAGRASVAADALFGSYLRTIIIMGLGMLPSIVAMGYITKSEDPKSDFMEALRYLPGLLIISAAIWSPVIFSGLMKEFGSKINWWAIPLCLYLAVAWSLAPYLLVDAKLGLWSALETSRRLVSRNWFGIAALYAIYYPAAWVFAAAISMIPGVFSTMVVVDDMAKKMRTDPINIMLGFSNIFMAGLFYLFLLFFQIALATVYIRILRPVGYRREKDGRQGRT